MKPSAQIDARIAKMKDWRGKMLAQLRSIIVAADSSIEEGWKWGTPVFTAHGGNVCAIAAFKTHVKVNFFKGASLSDPKKIINAGLEAKESRGIDLLEGGTIDASALSKLVRAAVKLNK